MLKSMAALDQLEGANAMKATSGSMKQHILARVMRVPSCVLKVVDKTTVSKMNHIDALTIAHTDLNSTGKKMLSSITALDQLDRANAMKMDSGSMKQQKPVRVMRVPSCVLKLVDKATAI